MKHAMLLLWHKDLIQLKELVLLFDFHFEFYIHIDKKSRISKEDIESLLRMEQIKVVCRKYKVNWGGFNILKAELCLLTEIVKDKTIDYIHFMSGQDYPAKRPDDIDAFFSDRNGLEFIQWHRLPFVKWEEGTYRRFDYFRLLDWFDYRSQKGAKKINRLVKWQQRIGYKRNIPHQYSNLYGASNWMSITRACAEYLISSLPANRIFYRRLKYTWAAEETYFPTVILNSPFARKVTSDNQRYIHWEYKNGSFPAILDEKDFADILISNCCFIRKVDREISQKLLANLKQYVLSPEPVQIAPEGYWKNETLSGHCFDNNLAKAIINILPYTGVKTIADFGCGPGWYVAYLRKLGYDVEGYDGNPNTPQISSLLFEDGFHCQEADLTEELVAEEPFDMILCLEVGEHIPAEQEDVLFGNLTRNARRYVLMSWAIEGQYGDGHVNCRSNEYVVSKMESYGFILNTPLSRYLRIRCSLWWFRDTIMLFERTNTITA